MKKLVCSMLLCVAGSACASTPAVSATTSAAPVAVAPAAAYESKTTSTISIAPRDNLIVATAITNWDAKASDKLAIQWVAPKSSYCQGSTFSVTRGPNTSHDVFWAYRTVVHTNSKGATVYCSGHWEAKVINTIDNKVLATAGYDVTAPTNSSTAAATTTATSSVSGQ